MDALTTARIEDAELFAAWTEALRRPMSERCVREEAAMAVAWQAARRVVVALEARG
jgi:hypothetical protein